MNVVIEIVLVTTLCLIGVQGDTSSCNNDGTCLNEAEDDAVLENMRVQMLQASVSMQPGSDIGTTKKTVKFDAKHLALRAFKKNAEAKMNSTTSTRPSSPNNWCRDLPQFADSDGDNCETIVSAGQCDHAGGYCVSGVCADGACCGCGGGVRSSEDNSVTPCTQLDATKRSGPVENGGHCATDTHTRNLQTIAQNKMMFFGDSDIEYWNTEEDFPGTVNCGVGGGTAWEAAQWAKQTANTYKPKDFVVFVSGENDVGGAGASMCVGVAFKDFKDAVMAFLDSPNKPTVIYMGTKPEPGSIDYYTWYNAYDKLVFEFASSPIVEGRLKVFDVFAAFLAMGRVGADGQTLFDTDDLHMNANGYQYWTNWVKNIMASCEDVSGWKDSDGDDCAVVRKNNYCAAADDFKVNGVGAKEACCACGGGNAR